MEVNVPCSNPFDVLDPCTCPVCERQSASQQLQQEHLEASADVATDKAIATGSITMHADRQSAHEWKAHQSRQTKMASQLTMHGKNNASPVQLHVLKVVDSGCQDRLLSKADMDGNQPDFEACFCDCQESWMDSEDSQLPQSVESEGCRPQEPTKVTEIPTAGQQGTKGSGFCSRVCSWALTVTWWMVASLLCILQYLGMGVSVLCHLGHQQTHNPSSDLPGVSQPYLVTARIKGTPVLASIDCGATSCFVRPEVLQQCGVHPVSLQSGPVSVQMGDKHTAQSGEIVPCLKVHLTNGVVLQLKLYVVKSLAYPLVLGTPFLKAYNPDIDWVNHKMTMIGNSGHWKCMSVVIPMHGQPPVVEEPKKRNIKIISYRQLYHHMQAFDYMYTIKLNLCPHHKHEGSHEHKTQMHQLHLDHLSALDATVPLDSRVEALLKEYDDIFAAPSGEPPVRDIEHTIELEAGTEPMSKAPYRLAPVELEELHKILDELLEQGRIRPSCSPFGSPVLLIKKKDGGLRLVIDYRALNSRTVKVHYPLPRIDDTFDQLAHAHVFSKLDLKSGYWQVRMREEDVEKTAFNTRFGQFEWVVMPQGLCNAPSTFQALMNRVFHSFLDHFVLVYLDDILVYSKTMDEHLQHLKQVFDKLREHKLQASKGKCAFAQPQLQFLGHVISEKGLHPDPALVQAILDWPVPKTVKQIQSFLGLAGYYRKFIAHFSTIAAPISELTHGVTPSANPDISGKWHMEQQIAFETLKSALVHAPVLQTYDPSKPSQIFCDASHVACGGTLMQPHDGQWHPVAYYSKKFNSAEFNYGIYDREMLAVINAISVWRHYLGSETTVIHSDQDALKYFWSQKHMDKHGRHARWLYLLQSYNFELRHIEGKYNLVADALSRRPDMEDIPALGQMATIIQSPLLKDVALASSCDPAMAELIKDLRQHSDPDYIMFQDLVVEKRPYGRQDFNRIMIPDNDALKERIIYEAHDVYGHMGFHSTLRHLVDAYVWPGMAADVSVYIKRCKICQINKTSTQKPYGLLHPLPIPDRKWQHISMDFVVELPLTSSGHDAIMTVVDKLTKFVILVPTLGTATAEQTAQLFMERVMPMSYIPEVIISDRDPKFTSTFWKTLFTSMGTKLAMSTAYHPQSDGQTERMNRLLQQVLRCYVSTCPVDWEEHLSHCALSINAAVNSSTGYAPYYLMYGCEPNMPLMLSASRHLESRSTRDMLEDMEYHIRLAKQHLAHATDMQALQANKRRRQHAFAEGHVVWLSTQNLSVISGYKKKLAPKWVGPFTITKMIGTEAARLDLPKEMAAVFPTFHVSLLKPFTGDEPEHTILPPVEMIAGLPYHEIDGIMGHRRTKGKHAHWQYFTTFKNQPIWQGAWLDANDFSGDTSTIQRYIRVHNLKDPNLPT